MGLERDHIGGHECLTFPISSDTFGDGKETFGVLVTARDGKLAFGNDGDFELEMKDVRDLIAHLQTWLRTGSLEA